MNPEEDRNADFKRALRRMLVIVVLALASTLGLIWYLWEHGPKPP